jgi:hypothetical protein
MTASNRWNEVSRAQARWAIHFYLEADAETSEPAFIGSIDECMAFADKEGLTRCMFKPYRDNDEQLAQEKHDHPTHPDDEHKLDIFVPEPEESKPFDPYEIGTLIIVIILIILFSGSIIWHRIPQSNFSQTLHQHQ